MRDGLREAMTRAGIRFEFDNTVAKVEKGPDGLAATLAAASFSPAAALPASKKVSK